MIEFSPRSAESVPLPGAGKFRLFFNERGQLSQMDDTGAVSLVAPVAEASDYELPEIFSGHQFVGGMIDGARIGPNCILSALGPISTRSAYTLSSATPIPILDTSATPVTLANSGLMEFPNFAGMIIVNDGSNSAVGLYICGAGSVVILGTTATVGGTVTYSSGIDGYAFTNTSGGSRAFTFMAFRTRGGA